GLSPGLSENLSGRTKGGATMNLRASIMSTGLLQDRTPCGNSTKLCPSMSSNAYRVVMFLSWVAVGRAFNF
ncbi:MAG TPA: hypothetical protein P5169_05285, partial [Kiritimatiellia bacterium]|nr:hypothetical protein [Kiritimatiellia bacterium]